MADYNIKDFVRKLEALNKVFTTMPTKIGTIAVNFSKERFREKNWIDNTVQPWKPLSRKRKSRSGSGKARKSQSILVDSGRLAHSIHKVYADQNLIIIATDVPYAQIHNEGGQITKSVEVRKHARREHQRKRAGKKGKKSTVKAHTVNAHMRKMNLDIPARQFMGESEELNRRIIQFIDNEFQNALNS
jgi:phage gpG-like protein